MSISTPQRPGPRRPLPPGVFPIIGPRLATDGVVQPIARQIGLTMLGTLHERIGDTLLQESPDGWGSSAWGRVFGDQIDNRYQAFADPNADGRIIGVQAGFDIGAAASFPAIAMPPALLRLWQQRHGCERPGHQPGGNRICEYPDRHAGSQRLFRRRILDPLRSRRMVSRRGAAGHGLHRHGDDGGFQPADDGFRHPRLAGGGLSGAAAARAELHIGASGAGHLAACRVQRGQ